MIGQLPGSLVDEQGELKLSEQDLARLVAPARARVEVHPPPADNPVHDRWILMFEDLSIMHSDLGLDAALIGFTYRVRERVHELLRGTSDERDRLLPLLVKLHLADRDGSLGAMLQRSTILVRPGPHRP